MGGTSGFSLVEVQRKVREIWHETIAPPWMSIALRETGVMTRLREIVSPKKRRQRGKLTGMEGDTQQKNLCEDHRCAWPWTGVWVTRRPWCRLAASGARVRRHPTTFSNRCANIWRNMQQFPTTFDEFDECDDTEKLVLLVISDCPSSILPMWLEGG